ncbi:uncharacterized protein LOC116417023 isoform X1 [Nasonia vitripennis]|uniref:Uncharacterized protein n=1 Tax=Nasonia vitripennis TaxID=7425 RepID=A0A7M7QB55_NASVI|nr:uncharacterized protein LOC116417023 isoform X1 [Nasonia vitripennis]
MINGKKVKFIIHALGASEEELKSTGRVRLPSSKIMQSCSESDLNKKQSGKLIKMKENVTLAKHVRLITDINQKRQALTHKSFNEIYPEDQSPNSKDQNKELATKTHSSQSPMENLSINENAFEHLVSEAVKTWKTKTL